LNLLSNEIKYFQDHLKLAIFDWDGTVMDSIGQIVASLQAVGHHFDLPLPAHAAQQVIGLGLAEVMHTLFPNHTAYHDDMRQVYANHYHAHPAAAPLFSGMRPLLSELRARGVMLAVATGKNRAGLNRVLNQSGLNDYFTITRAADEALSKPNPLMLQQILDITQIEAKHAVMIGDTTFDLQMAQAIAMPCIGVLWGAHSRADLAGCEPFAMTEAVADLKQILG
jgi:phosphoglycolate phosphatase